MRIGSRVLSVERCLLSVAIERAVKGPLLLSIVSDKNDFDYWIGHALCKLVSAFFVGLN